jgi:hypothetical protein
MCVSCNVAGKYQDAASAKTLLEQAVSWREERNLYPERSFIGLADWKNRKLLPAGYLCDNVEEWCKFWGMPPTKSTQGKARFQGGDIVAKLRIDLPAVTAADLQLAKGSPGQSEEKSLGADTKLVGPGEAFGRFRDTPAYQEWRK